MRSDESDENALYGAQTVRLGGGVECSFGSEFGVYRGMVYTCTALLSKPARNVRGLPSWRGV